MVKESPLGQPTIYIETYSPELLFPISRSLARDKIGMKALPFHGVDLWSGFEISWLNPKGKPVIALANFIIPCNTPNIIESKSFKLYLNSFNQSKFSSFEEVQAIMQKDLSQAAGSPVGVDLYPIRPLQNPVLQEFLGICLDEQDIEAHDYIVNKEFLSAKGPMISESVYSDLLKSNCLATGQPDWGSLFIRYTGSKIDHEGLLKYIISFRRHSGFAEHCVEHIYNDILTQCRPEQLTVYARYTRRGGLDINPFRSNFEHAPLNLRQIRQ